MAVVSIANLRRQASEQSNRAALAERRERDLAAENTRLRRRVAELEAKVGSAGL